GIREFHVTGVQTCALPICGDLQVAAFNVLNYFTTLGSRGADTPEEFQRQQAKIVAALAAIDAEVVGVMEIENNVTAIANLVDALNAAVGAGTYAYIDTRSEEHTSELQSRENLVCRLLLEKKK